jgi:hypothetical protein
LKQSAPPQHFSGGNKERYDPAKKHKKGPVKVLELYIRIK